jgi:hypothetical protein
MLLVRFTVLILIAIAAIVAVAILDTWWAVALAALVTLALLAQTAVLLFHYLSAGDNDPDEDLLEAADLVEGETGLPTRRRWNERVARAYAADIARRGRLAIPERWRGPEGEHNVLLVAADAIDGQRFLDDVLHDRPSDDVAVLVVAPALAQTAARFHAGDATEAVEHGEAVARATVAALRGVGLRAEGHIGAADPAVAVSQGLRTYAPDRVVVARRHSGRLRYLEDVPVAGAADAFGVPLEEVDLSVSAPERPQAWR